MNGLLRPEREKERSGWVREDVGRKHVHEKRKSLRTGEPENSGFNKIQLVVAPMC